VNAVMAVKFGSESEVFSFMTRDLYKGEYRVYEWKNLLISIHNSIDLNIVVSSAHAVLNDALPPRPPNAAQQVGLPSRLSPTATADLVLLKNDTLQQLARALGESESGTKGELIARISRQPLPLPDKSDIVAASRRFDNHDKSGMQAECRTRHLKATGSKEQMINRVTKFDKKEGVQQERINALLDDKESIDDPVQPTINTYYRDTFNVVDNFNKCLHEAHWPHDVHHEHMFYIISCLRMATTNILTVYFELQGIMTKPEIRRQIGEMAEALWQ